MTEQEPEEVQDDDSDVLDLPDDVDLDDDEGDDQ